MASANVRRVDRREAAIAGTLAAAVFTIVGYATGFGLVSPGPSSASISDPMPGPPAINYVVPPGQDLAFVPAAATAALPASPTYRSPSMPTMPGMSAGPGTGAAMGTVPTHTVSRCTGLAAAQQSLLVHVYGGHLGESPSQQLADILNTDQYAQTHTALLGSVLAPVVSGLTAAENTLLQHIYSGHLDESPSQQLADIVNVDQYAATHTALIATLLQLIHGHC